MPHSQAHFNAGILSHIMAGVYPTLWALSLLLARPRPAGRTSQTTTKSDQLLRASDRMTTRPSDLASRARFEAIKVEWTCCIPHNQARPDKWDQQSPVSVLPLAPPLAQSLASLRLL